MLSTAPLRERWLERRARWVADPEFRDKASRLPATRGLARRQAGELFDLMAGFVYSQVLSACVKLRLFDRLAAAPASTEALAAAAALPLAAATRLLEAAEALELVRRCAFRAVDAPAPASTGTLPAPDSSPTAVPATRWALGRLGAAMAANPALDALVLHHAALYADLENPLALLRANRGRHGEAEGASGAAAGVAPGAGAKLARYWSYATARAPGELPADEVAPYSAVMSASQALIARQVLDAYPMHRHRCLLDVGGGEGAFLAAALASAPQLRGLLWDLPAVAERARARLAAQGLAPRCEVHGGDFKRNALPRGADLVSLVRVLYDHDDEPALRLLTAVRAALPSGGTVLVAEPLARTKGAERMGAAYFGIYLWAMGSGRVRSAAEHIALLRAAGFRGARERRTALPLQTGLVVARAP